MRLMLKVADNVRRQEDTGTALRRNLTLDYVDTGPLKGIDTDAPVPFTAVAEVVAGAIAGSALKTISCVL